MVEPAAAEPVLVSLAPKTAPRAMLSSSVRSGLSERPALAAPAARYRIDWGFIQAVEGKPRARGYVPASPRTGRALGRSGVTVATGFDLGQHDAADLRRLGIDGRLVAVLQPYLRRQGRSAQALLVRYPLTLSPDELWTLDRAKHLDTARKIERRFDAARAPHVPPFATLSPAQQTVIFSLATQYGTRLDRKTPAFWNHVVNGRFDDAVRELRHFGDRYTTRRNREADLLVGERRRIDSPLG